LVEEEETAPSEGGERERSGAASFPLQTRWSEAYTTAVAPTSNSGGVPCALAVRRKKKMPHASIGPKAK
jgi:hypothetical protein